MMAVSGFSAEKKKELEGFLDALPVGGVFTHRIDDHRFVAIKTKLDGLHTGRPRFFVGCDSCQELLHEATTGPVERMDQHLSHRSTNPRDASVPIPDLSRPLNEIAELKQKLAQPIALRLNCPDCGHLHIDEGEFATKPHHTHACQFCGNVWRPAIVNTVGVQFLPGFKNS
jgi:hypothetical protein